jgi:hypothetical protein
MKQKLLLIYIAFSFFACKPEPTPDQYNYYYLTAEQLAKTPYFTNPAFDTLTFVSNQNDTVVFAKTRVDSGWYKIIDASPGNNYTVYHYYQQHTAKYQTIKGEGSFEVQLNKRNVPFNFSYPVSNFIQINFLNDVYTFYMDVLGDTNYPKFIGNLFHRNIEQFNTMYEYSMDNYQTKKIGMYSSNGGLFSIIDSLKSVQYEKIN